MSSGPSPRLFIGLAHVGRHANPSVRTSPDLSQAEPKPGLAVSLPAHPSS